MNERDEPEALPPHPKEEQRRPEATSPGHRSNAGSNYGDYAPDEPKERSVAERQRRESGAEQRQDHTENDPGTAEHSDSASRTPRPVD
jgi:hypothetical protein